MGEALFLEIILRQTDMIGDGIQREEVEEALNQALEAAQLGAVTGGGAGSGVVVWDVEIWEEQRFPEALALMRRVLQACNVPETTCIQRYTPERMAYGLTE